MKICKLRNWNSGLMLVIINVDTSHNMAEVLGKNPLDERVIQGRNTMEGVTP